MDLSAYEVILINTSAGKDSLAMLDHVYSLALAQEATGRLQAVYSMGCLCTLSVAPKIFCRTWNSAGCGRLPLRGIAPAITSATRYPK